MSAESKSTPSAGPPSVPITISPLKSSPKLWYKLHFLLYDLTNFSTDSASHARLDSVVDPLYIGEPYFSPDEASAIKYTHLSPAATTNITTAPPPPAAAAATDAATATAIASAVNPEGENNERGKTLAEAIGEQVGARLERRDKKRVESGDFRVCAAHDLALVLAGLLGIELKLMEKDKGFVRLVKEKGLELGQERWEGLKKKSFAPKQKGKRKKR